MNENENLNDPEVLNEEEQSSALMVKTDLTPEVLFSKEEHVIAIIDQIEAIVKSEPADITTPKGRKKVKSLAYKIARSKTTLEDMADSVTADWERKSKEVKSLKKLAKTRLDEMKKNYEESLTKWNEREKQRVADLQASLEAIRALRLAENDSSEVIKSKFEKLKELNKGDIYWNEFNDLAVIEIERTLEALNKFFAISIEREELAEKARIKAESEAAEKAKAEADRVRLEKEKLEAEKLKAEQDKIAAEKRFIELKEKAKRDAEAAKQREEEQLQMSKERERLAREDAAKKERERIDREAQLEKDKEAARQRDLEHKKKIHNEAKSALLSHSSLDDSTAQMVIALIACGKIPHVNVRY